MSEAELDQVYTDFCHALSDVGEAAAAKALCRFALLAMLKIDDPAEIEQIMRRALLATS